MASEFSDSNEFDCEEKLDEFLNMIRKKISDHQQQKERISSRPTTVPVPLKPKDPPSLVSLCLKKLKDLQQHVSSLEGLPDSIRKVISDEFCFANLMRPSFFKLFFLIKAPSAIWIKNCNQISTQDFRSAFENLDTTQLKVLKLDCCKQLNDTCGTMLCSRPLHNLRLLSLKQCSLSPSVWRNLILNARALTSLNLGGCQINQDLIAIIASHLGPTLSELFLDGCQFTRIDTVAHIGEFSALRLISISRVPRLTDEMVSSFLPKIGANLLNLNLDESGITDKTLKLIGRCCAKISALSVSCTNLTYRSLFYIHVGCPELTEFNFGHQFGVGDEAISTFIELSGPKLLKINLFGAKFVGCHTACAIARFCPNITQLDISHTLVSETDLENIIANCARLEKVVLCGCIQISEEFRRNNMKISDFVTEHSLEGRVKESLKEEEYSSV